MEIQQAYVGVKFFKESFLKKFQLVQYNNRFRPSIFFGLYRKQQHILYQHKSIAIIIWAGTDVIHMKNNPIFLKYVKSRKDVFHIAISNFIEKDLKELNLPYTTLPIIPQIHNELKAEPLGDSIYMYTSEKSPEIYGEHYLAQIKKMLPNFNFIIATAHCYTREQLKDIYKKCFIGLRLTKHDGLSNTCIELGLMGRKVIWNGNTPNAIPYKTVNDIVQIIQSESEKIGQIDHELVTKVKSYLKLPNDWLNTNYYLKTKYEASVIINTYKNDITQLKDAIESYLMQQQVKVQLIISTAKGDSAIQVAKSYGLECCVSEKPGIYEQLNKAIKMVKTDWFSYASGNDVAAPTKMINEIECCLKNNKKICYSNFYHTDKDLKVTRTTDFHKYDYKVHLKGNFVNDCATIHKSILDKYMPFDITWKNHAYWDFWLRVYEGEGDVFCFNPNPEWYYRVSKNSKHIQRSRNPEKIKQNKKMKIYYQYSYLKTLTPSGGDQINEIGICTALSQFAEVYYSGQLFKPAEKGFGLKEYPGEIKVVDADISIIRANKEVFLKAKGKRIWISSPYDFEMFSKADYIGTFTESWTKALKEGETYQNLNPGIKWPNAITLYQTLNHRFKPLKDHPETLKIKEKYKDKFVIGIFGRLVESNYPNLVLNSLKTIQNLGCEVLFSITRQKILLPDNIKITRFNHSKMPYALNACDCVIISQHGEEWEICGSLKTLEPMACGVPVILEHSRAREEMFGKNYPLFLKRGLFTPGSDKEADLIEKIKLLFNQRFRDKISKKLIQKAKFYSVQQSSSRLERLMKGL